MNNWQPDVKFEEGVFKFDLPNGDEFVIVPPQTKPLSDEEIVEIYNSIRSDKNMTWEEWCKEEIDFVRAIEERHGIK